MCFNFDIMIQCITKLSSLLQPSRLVVLTIMWNPGFEPGHHILWNNYLKPQSSTFGPGFTAIIFPQFDILIVPTIYLRLESLNFNRLLRADGSNLSLR